MTFSTDQKHRLLSRMGYAGPAGEEGMKNFLQTNPTAARKFLAFDKAAAALATPPTPKPAAPVRMAEGGVYDPRLLELYQTNFGRTPEQDKAGFDFWQGELDSGASDINKIQANFEAHPTNLLNSQTTTTGGTTGAATTGTGTTGVQTVLPGTTTTTTTGAQTTGVTQPDAYKTDPNYAKINKLYEEILGRPVDDAGAQFWVQQMGSGFTEDQMRANLEGVAAETATGGTTGTVTDYSGVSDITTLPDYNTLSTIYTKYFGSDRAIDPEGAKFWQQQLDANFDPAEMEKIFKETSEAQTYTNTLNTNVDQIFKDAIGRPTANDVELEPFREMLRNGATPEQVKGALLSNADYFGEGFNSQYLKLYGMLPSAEQIKEFEESGVPITDWVAGKEGEFKDAEATLTNIYRELFNRNPDEAGLEFWMNQFRNGMSVEDIANKMAEGTERQDVEYESYQQSRDLLEAQKKMVQDAYKDPAANVTTADVAQMTETPGTIIDPTTGQVGAAPQIDPSLITGTATADLPEETETNTVDVTKVSEQVQQELNDLEAAKGTVSKEGTVRGQLELLMEDFENDGTPPWASGAMRAAMSKMQARGLGASSMAGQAIVQAAMESALPIAMQDASTTAQFELQNLTNEQQTVIFKAQQRFAGIFSDQSAENAAKQFNASSQNQTDQFFASLQESVSRFNATQVNAITKSNVDSENAAKQFNAQMVDMRDRFNAQNSLVIAQSNAQWRQNISTINTAAQNDANMEAAKTANAFTGSALEQLWQRERDLMAFAFTSSESAIDREVQMLLADKQEDLVRWKAGQEEDASKGYLLTKIASDVFFGSGGSDGDGILGGIFG